MTSKDARHAGFVYAGRTRDGSVIKIGMTMQDDPASYVKRRYTKEKIKWDAPL